MGYRPHPIERRQRPLLPQRRHLRHDAGRRGASHRRRRGACLSGHSPVGRLGIGFSGMEMQTLVRYNFPVKIVVLNNGGIGPGMPEIPQNPMFNLKPNALIYGARYDKVMEAFGGKGLFVENPKDIRGALDEAMKYS